MEYDRAISQKMEVQKCKCYQHRKSQKIKYVFFRNGGSIILNHLRILKIEDNDKQSFQCILKV